MKRVAGDTREAILAAAATEFAAHGFAGASVDTIAARSRFNKAMIYYHFKSKQGLYVEILRDGFRSVGARTTALVESNLTPEAKIEGFIDTFNEMAATRPYMPPMMMREIAEGAVRLDADTLRLMARIFDNLRRILEEGDAARRVPAGRPDPHLLHADHPGHLLPRLHPHSRSIQPPGDHRAQAGRRRGLHRPPEVHGDHRPVRRRGDPRRENRA